MLTLKENARALLSGAFGSILVFTMYLAAVVVSTPIFSPRVAILLALERNWPTMTALSLGLGAQIGLIVYRRGLPCPTKASPSTATGTTISGSALSAFASLVGLANIGCCSLFIFYLSTAVGLGTTTLLLQYSEPLTAAGIALMVLSIGFNVRLIMSVRKQLASSALYIEPR